jgi:hypothetical protein
MSYAAVDLATYNAIQVENNREGRSSPMTRNSEREELDPDMGAISGLTAARTSA